MGGKQNKFKERDVASYKREIEKVEPRQGKRESLIVLSFRDFDRNQGQSFGEWEQEKLLALAVSKLHEVCNLTKMEVTRQQIIKEYRKGVFPSNSDFTEPKHITPPVTSWCSMHIQGKECVIGYFEDNIFNIVFLDKDHRFWITEKKNT